MGHVHDPNKPELRTRPFEKTDGSFVFVGRLFRGVHVLEHSDGKRAEAIKILGISRNNFWEELRNDKAAG